MSASPLPKVWYITTKDELRVVRITAAGIILSDHSVDPTLYDHDTAKKVADNLSGIMSQGGVIISLMVKPRNPQELRAT